MPCRVYEPEEVAEEQSRELAFLSAALCAVFSWTETQPGGSKAFLDKLDWSAAGVTHGAVKVWWPRHRKKDALRLLQEREEHDREEARQTALAKLTDDERRLLGLKR
jgi:hypothetical protein